MQLPDFIQFVLYDKKGNGTTYILSKSLPYYIGKVVQFEGGEDEMTDWMARKKADTGRCIAGKVPYHSILVVYSGRLDGSVLLPESAITFKAMAQWYFENRILPNERRYKKYLENQY